jgi:hypothetical protein
MKKNIKKNGDGLEGVQICRKSCGMLQTEMILVGGMPQPPSRINLMRLKEEIKSRKS